MRDEEYSRCGAGSRKVFSSLANEAGGGVVRVRDNTGQQF